MPKDSSISSSNALTRFGIRSALFFAPVAGLLALATGSLYFAGELTPIADVVQAQQQSPGLYYPMGHPRSFVPQYKLLGATARHPDFLVLGASRANSMRAEFVRGPADRFYNAAVWSAESVSFARQFLERLPQDCLPHHLLLNVDPWWFYKNVKVPLDRDFFRSSTPAEIVDFSWRTGLWWATQRQAYTSSSARIGILAKQKDSGLRPDGSYLAGDSLFVIRDSVDQSQFQQIEDRTDSWFHQVTADLSPAAVAELQRLLDYCSAHHISVVGYMSPFSPFLYDAVRKDERLSLSLRVAPSIRPLFEQRGFMLFDLTNPAVPGCGAGEYSDLVHESEVCGVRDLLAMTRLDPKMTALVDPNKLESFLATRKSDWRLAF
jgi:hypothetical protein